MHKLICSCGLEADTLNELINKHRLREQSCASELASMEEPADTQKGYFDEMDYWARIREESKDVLP